MPTSEAGRIEVHVRELNQLFHSLDPAPFYERDLDRDAEAFIVSNAKELPRDVPLSLVVHVAEPSSAGDDTRLVADAVRIHFGRRVERSRSDLRQLFRRGRVSLAIGLPFLAASIIGGEMVLQKMALRPLAEVLRHSFLIGGWVAMWRPMEIFLYDWWPIRDERRIFERLGSMEVRVVPATAA